MLADRRFIEYMTYNILEYPLVDGFIHNWLVAGPQVLAQRPDEPLIVPGNSPLEHDEFPTSGGTERWLYYRCLEDHLVDLSTLYSPGDYARAWAFAKLVSPAIESTSLQVYTSGPVEVLLNGQVVFQSPAADQGSPQKGQVSYSFQVSLREENELLVRFAAHTSAATRHTLALGLAELADENLCVQVPTVNMFPNRHKRFEELFDYAYLEKFVHHKGNLINILWAEEAERMVSYSYKVQDSRQMNYVTGNAEITDLPYDAGHPQRLWERPLFVTLTAPEREFWDMGARYARRLPLQVLDTAYAPKPEETYVQRRKLALEHASRREPNLFAEIAKMVLEQWDKVQVDNILEVVEQVKALKQDSLTLLVGLLGMVYRFKDQPDFPSQVIKSVESALLGYAYPGLTADTASTLSEIQELLSCTAALLAGQLLPQRSFTEMGMKGNKLRQAAEAKIQAWIDQHGRQGFASWHADTEIEGFVLALSHLVSLAEDQSVRELAAVLLDKIIFLLAVNSHQGVYGAAHSSVSAGGVKSGQLLAGTALNRLLYGVGVYNRYIAGPVSLACSEYEFPSFFAEIAVQSPKALLHKECQVGMDGSQVNLVSYRTPDYLLSSVQDYRPGQTGAEEQVWQATLGPDTLVYTNHPGAMGEQEGLQPGFWLGNGILPRVAQWKENLVAVYNLSEDGWMGFTHAHFPVNAFDETVFARGWAFGRVGDGFIGLTCSAGFEQIRQGVGAFRELRSAGRQNVWLCVMGNKAVYRGFRKFQKKCMAIQPNWQLLGVKFTSPQEDEIVFSWQGALQVNGEEQPLSAIKHIENPYCTAELGASHMDIQYGEILMRLNFG